MSRFIEDDDRPSDQGDDKHARARKLAEAALRAEEAGDTARADDLFAQAERTDIQAVENVLMENPEHPAVVRMAKPISNEEGVARILRAVRPH